MKLTIILSVIVLILFAVACGGGKDADAPAAAVKAIAPTDVLEPTPAPNPVSSQSPTPPPISMVLDTVSPELLSCVKTALGDEQYGAIITGRQDAVAEQLGLVLPCILQYPQEANAIMEMFGVDIETVMAANSNTITLHKPETPNDANSSSSIPTPTLLPSSSVSSPLTRQSVVTHSNAIENPEANLIPDSFPVWKSRCNGTGPVVFSQPPMQIEDIGHIVPYGMVIGAHVTPIDHMYLTPADLSLGRDAYEVRAIQDGLIYNLQPRDIFVDTGEANDREWRLDIGHTCTFSSYIDLMTSLHPDLEREWMETLGPNSSKVWQGIEIDSGQLLGWIGAQTLDFGVYDYQVILEGFVNPSTYDREPWKIHTIDPFPHFPEDVSRELLAKMLRTVEPRAGKIDHDINGKLVGNWFQQSTNGYQGLEGSKYWDGHLAIVPDHIDPTQWRFSIGNFNGPAAQFGLKGNGPDPNDITPETGVTLYELVEYQYLVGKEETRPLWGANSQLNWRSGESIFATNTDFVKGIALLQMEDPQLLRVEVFPGKSADQVSGFTNDSKLYIR